MSFKVNLFHPLFILLLITSQTYSLIASIGLPYVANDKIAFLLVLIFFLSHPPVLTIKDKNILLTTFVVSTFLISFLIFRYFSLGIDVNASSFNHVLAMWETVLFALYYRKFSVSVLLRSLLICLSIHLFFASIQVVLAFNGLSELTGIFSNYSPRSDYIIYADEGLTGAVIGLPRAYGLFHEASGLSVLIGLVLLLCLLSMLSKFIPNNTILFSMISYLRSKPVLILFGLLLSVLGVTLTYSLTGLLYTFFPVVAIVFLSACRFFSLNTKVSWPFIVLLLTLIAVPFVFHDQTIGFVFKTFTSSTRYGRTSEYLNSIPNISDQEFFFGRAMTWFGATWDFPTRIFQIFGLIGGLFNYIWYIFILFPFSSPLSLAALAASLSNGSLAASASLLMLSFAIYLNSPLLLPMTTSRD